MSSAAKPKILLLGEIDQYVLLHRLLIDRLTFTLGPLPPYPVLTCTSTNYSRPVAKSLKRPGPPSLPLAS